MQASGESLCGALAELLREAGFEVDPPIPASIGYWIIDASLQRASLRMWVYHALFPESGIVVKRNEPLFSFLNKGPSLADILNIIHSKLSADPRFTEIGWFEGRDPGPEGLSPVPVTP